MVILGIVSDSSLRLKWLCCCQWLSSISKIVVHPSVVMWSKIEMVALKTKESIKEVLDYHGLMAIGMAAVLDTGRRQNTIMVMVRGW